MCSYFLQMPDRLLILLRAYPTKPKAHVDCVVSWQGSHCSLIKYCLFLQPDLLRSTFRLHFLAPRPAMPLTVFHTLLCVVTLPLLFCETCLLSCIAPFGWLYHRVNQRQTNLTAHR